MHGIFKDRLLAWTKHYQSKGITPRVHGSKGKQQSHALTPVDCQRVVDFIFNYAAQHNVLLPGHIPGYKRDDMKLLTQNHLPDLQASYCNISCWSVAAKTFNKLWQTYCLQRFGHEAVIVINILFEKIATVMPKSVLPKYFLFSFSK